MVPRPGHAGHVGRKSLHLRVGLVQRLDQPLGREANAANTTAKKGVPEPFLVEDRIVLGSYPFVLSSRRLAEGRRLDEFPERGVHALACCPPQVRDLADQGFTAQIRCVVQYA